MKQLNIILLAAALLVMGCSSLHADKFVHPPTSEIDTNLILPPAWAFGVLYGGYTDQDQTIERIEQIIAHDYPIDAYWIDSWFWSFHDKGIGPHKYMDFVADTVAYPNRQAMWSFMENNNVKGGFWAWDCIFQTGNETAFEDFKNRGYFRNTYMETNSWHNKSTTTAMYAQGDQNNGTLCGNIDFNSPEAISYFKQRMKHFFDEGADFIKLDRTSAIPVCKVMFEMSQEFGQESKGRGLVLSHTGGVETAEYKRYPAKWTDDTRSDWNIEYPMVKFPGWVPKIAFKENIAMFTDPNNHTSDIPFLTNDTGGFDMGKTDCVEEELYIRWLQFSIFNQLVEVFSQPENPTANIAYNYSSRADSLFRIYSHMRMELFPYIYSYAHRMRLEGKHMIGKLNGQLYDYLFGDEILVAPVYERGARSRVIDLPLGRWINYWTGEMLEGGIRHTVNAPIEQLPIFVREGAIIPMREYARSIEHGTNDKLMLHLYPGADSKFILIEDDGLSNDYLKGIYAKTTITNSQSDNESILEISPVLGFYESMNTQRTIVLNIHTKQPVKELTMDGKKLDFDQTEIGVISKAFSTKRTKGCKVKIIY